MIATDNKTSALISTSQLYHCVNKYNRVIIGQRLFNSKPQYWVTLFIYNSVGQGDEEIVVGLVSEVQHFSNPVTTRSNLYM